MASHYEALDLPHSANDHEIRSAYRRRALATHPDKGGSAEAFRSVVKAFETLIDPLLRKSYDADLLVSAQKKAPKGRAEGKPKGRRPKEPNIKKRKFEAKDEADSKRSGAENFSEDHAEVFRKIMKLPCKEIRAEVRKLTEETLRGLSNFLESLIAEHQRDPPAAPLPLDNGPCKEPPLAPAAVRKSGGRKIKRAKRKEVRLGSEARVNQKGVTHWKNKNGSFSYVARIYLNCLLVSCQVVRDLDIAIEMHMSLVQMRQYVLADLNAGKTFPEALARAVQTMNSERPVDAEPMKLRYHPYYRNKHMKTTQTLEDAMGAWNVLMKERRDFNLAQGRDVNFLKQPMLEAQRRRELSERILPVFIEEFKMVYCRGLLLGLLH